MVGAATTMQSEDPRTANSDDDEFKSIKHSVSKLEVRLRKKLIGQEGVIRRISSAVMRKETNWSETTGPLVFLIITSRNSFTNSAKCLVQQLAAHRNEGFEDRFVQFDMFNNSSLNKFTQLTAPDDELSQLLIDHPRTVVWLKGIEYADVEVQLELLRIFTESRLSTDPDSVTCQEVIFVLTSGICEMELDAHMREQYKSLETALEPTTHFRNNVLLPKFQKYFRNSNLIFRMDEICYLVPPGRIAKINLVQKYMERMAKQALEKHKIILTWDREVTTWLSERSEEEYNSNNVVDRCVIGPIALAEQYERITRGCKVHLDVGSSKKKSQTELVNLPDESDTNDNSRDKLRFCATQTTGVQFEFDPENPGNF